MTARTKADAALIAGRGAWRALAGPRVRRALQPAVRMLVEQRVLRQLKGATPQVSPGSIVVSGLFSESKGVSEGARLTLRGLQAGGFEPVQHDLRDLLDQGPGGQGRLPGPGKGGVWLIHANAPEALAALASAAREDWAARYRIGYWAYELPEAPPSWVRAARAFHEIWVPSRFVADSLLIAGVETPIRVMPHPVGLGLNLVHPDREVFGLPREAFCVLAMGDLNSSAARKNLMGAIEAFRMALGNDPAACLVIKTQSEKDHPQFVRDARKAASDLPDVRFIAGTFDRINLINLITSCDVLFSPHRSEGFGLTLAEAFCAGIPALATGFSGNLDFMRSIPELLVGFALTQVKDPYGVYRETRQLWAEPDLADAARKLKALRVDSELRERLAGRGREAVMAQTREWMPERLANSEFCKHIAIASRAA